MLSYLNMGVADHVFLLHAYVMHCICDTSNGISLQNSALQNDMPHINSVGRFFKDIASVVERKFIELFKAKSLSYMCRGWKEILSYPAPPDQRPVVTNISAIFLFSLWAGIDLTVLWMVVLALPYYIKSCLSGAWGIAGKLKYIRIM